MARLSMGVCYRKYVFWVVTMGVRTRKYGSFENSIYKLSKNIYMLLHYPIYDNSITYISYYIINIW